MLVKWLRGNVQTKNSIFVDIVQIKVDLPPSPRIFDKNHKILGFKTLMFFLDVAPYILYYPYYFLRVRCTDRKTQIPFKWIFADFIGI